MKRMFLKFQIAINFETTIFVEAKDHQCVCVHPRVSPYINLCLLWSSDQVLYTKNDFCGEGIPQHSTEKGLVWEVVQLES